MKSYFSLFVTASVCALLLTQFGCAGYYSGPVGYSGYSPTVVVNPYAWAGSGFYGGSYYGNNGYYGHGGYGGWNKGSGNYYGARGGSASWGGGSGSWHGANGGSGSWHR